MRADDLSSRVDRSLRALPAPHAPGTLLPRVLAAVSAWAERPWYARAWLTWPLGLQIASGVALALLLAGAAIGVAQAGAVPALMMSEAASRIGAAGTAVQTMAAAFDVLWRGIVQPVAPYALAVVSMMCLACAACAAALNQIVMGRAVHR